MKIALIQTPWSDASAKEFKGVATKYALYPPLGLMYLAASVERAGHQAEIIDLEVQDLMIDEIVARISQAKVDLIGITTTTPVFHVAKRYARELKRRLGLPVVVGGAHITVTKEQSFADEFDYAVVQEGEESLAELMTELEGERRLESINGLIWRQDGQVRINPPRPYIKDIDALPFPDRDKVDINKYVFEVPGKGVVPVGTLELTRGCPFKCVFCSEPLNTGRSLRKRSPKNAVDEIELMRDRYGITHVNLLDSTLTVNRKLIEGFCDEILTRGLKITWEGHTRANLVDEALLVKMKRAGLLRLTFGFESVDANVLRLMKKEVAPEAMRTALHLCKKLGIESRCGLMMGNPGETKKTVLRTAWFIRSIPEILYAPMSIAIPYPGTELAYMAANNMHGLRLLESDYSRYSRYAGGVMEVDGMMPDDLVKLQRRALFIMHSTPRKVLGLIQHFGFQTIMLIGGKMVWKEVLSWFGLGEKLEQTAVSADNTTLAHEGFAAGEPAQGKWPKVLPVLTTEQQRIRDDFMHYWHEVLPKRYGAIEKFNHEFAVREAPPMAGCRTLELGAGLGEHLAFEDLSRQDYHCVELRPEMAAEITRRFPGVTAKVGDCQQRLPYPDAYFDRVVVVHMLEHLPDLPAALAEIKRVMKSDGVFALVYPCDPGLAYGLARRISAQRIFEKRYKMSYGWFIRQEHINSPKEIEEELARHFDTLKRRYFPLGIPVGAINLCIGSVLRLKRS